MDTGHKATFRLVLGATAIYFLLMWGATRWPNLLSLWPHPGSGAATATMPTPFGETGGGLPAYPVYALMKLLMAGLLGGIVTQVHKKYHREKLLSRSLEQAQILLCISGAMMMVVIGDSLPRAFGIAGAAAIIRFRTPVEDPKDTTILFLVLGVGMACGLGAFGVAGIASFFLCFTLFVMDRVGEQKPRTMMLELTASGPDFPTAHVQNIFAAYGATCEPREMSHGEEAVVKYSVVLAPNTPLDYMSDQLISGGLSGIKSVSWQTPKKSG